jgi:hypothetical protein
MGSLISRWRFVSSCRSERRRRTAVPPPQVQIGVKVRKPWIESSSPVTDVTGTQRSIEVNGVWKIAIGKE